MSRKNSPDVPAGEAERLFKTVAGTGEDRFVEKKSVFIGAAAPVSSEEEAAAFVSQRRKMYPDARHHVWAYILSDGRSARYSDDGEPQGTGGLPMLEVLKKSGVENTVAVVTRYFGGVLLGTGGLTRAYSKGAQIALAAAGIVTYYPLSVYEFRCEYADYQKIQKELAAAPCRIGDSDFGEDVRLTVEIRSSAAETLIETLTDLTGGRMNWRKTGEKIGLLEK